MAMCATHFYTSRQLGWFVSSEVGYDPLIVLRLATSFGEAPSDQYALVWHLHYLTLSLSHHNDTIPFTRATTRAIYKLNIMISI